MLILKSINRTLTVYKHAHSEKSKFMVHFILHSIEQITIEITMKSSEREAFSLFVIVDDGTKQINDETAILNGAIELVEYVKICDTPFQQSENAV